MIPWWVALIAWVIGEAMGIAEMAICSGNWDNIQKKKRPLMLAHQRQRTKRRKEIFHE